MNLRSHIITITCCRHQRRHPDPFYPHFFSERYGLDIRGPRGAYVAAISIAVLCTLPICARGPARSSRSTAGLHAVRRRQLHLPATGADGRRTGFCRCYVHGRALPACPVQMRSPSGQHAAPSACCRGGALRRHLRSVWRRCWRPGGPAPASMPWPAGDFFQMASACTDPSGKIVRVTAALVRKPPLAAPRRVDWRARLPIRRLRW